MQTNTDVTCALEVIIGFLELQLPHTAISNPLKTFRDQDFVLMYYLMSNERQKASVILRSIQNGVLCIRFFLLLKDIFFEWALLYGYCNVTANLLAEWLLHSTSKRVIWSSIPAQIKSQAYSANDFRSLCVTFIIKIYLAK